MRWACCLDLSVRYFPPSWMNSFQDYSPFQSTLQSSQFGNPGIKKNKRNTNERKSHTTFGYRMPVVTETQLYVISYLSSAKKLLNKNRPAAFVETQTQQLHRRWHQEAGIPSFGKDETPVRVHFGKTFPATAEQDTPARLKPGPPLRCRETNTPTGSRATWWWLMFHGNSAQWPRDGTVRLFTDI